MTSDRLSPEEEMTGAADLPQADASSLVDRELLEAQVKDMYRQVAREQEADLHFEVGRPLALRVGYPSDLLDRIPAEALASFAGVGYHLDLAALAPANRCSISAQVLGRTPFAPRSRLASPDGWSASTSPMSRSPRRLG